jgi:pimeloyl-ACP methyl ester carboxylesterase
MEPTDAVTYLSQGKFHRSIICKRTQKRVTFALIGEWSDEHQFYYPRSASIDESDRPIILYVLPSGCSRYVGLQLDGIASAHGVRILAVDRPGAGGTPSCQGVDRMKTSTSQTISVLESLGFGQTPRRINILTHSAGWLYALDLLSQRGDLFDKSTRIAFCSPFVPTHLSGNTVLAMLPKSVVQLLPSASSLLEVCGSTIAWSSGIGQDLGLLSSDTIESEKDVAQQKVKGERTREKSKARLPTARFHPPYESHLGLGLEAWKTTKLRQPGHHPKTGRRIKDGQSLLFEYLRSEGGAKAMTEDFLFCLGKFEGMDNRAMKGWMEARLGEVASCYKREAVGKGSRLRVLVVWGEKDFLIPSKGRTYIDGLFQLADVAMIKWIMADGGHDAAIASKEVMGDVLDYLADSST